MRPQANTEGGKAVESPDRMSVLRELRALVARYEEGLDFYRRPQSRYNETDARVELIDPLLRLMGWDVNNSRGIRGDLRDVVREEGSTADGVATKPDYTLRHMGRSKLYVEAKRPSLLIERDSASALQVRKYGFTKQLPVSVLTNFHTLSIYDTRFPIQPTDTASSFLIYTADFCDYASKWDEICGLLGREAVHDESWLQAFDLAEQTTPLSVSDVFVSQYNSWRMRLAQSLIDHDPALTDEAVNDVVQRLLNRLIFVRMCEDRGIEGSETLFRARNSEVDLRELFKRLNRRYNTGIFDYSRAEYEPVGLINSSVISSIVDELYSPFSTVSYAVISAEFLGMVYETSLAEHIVVRARQQDPRAELAPKQEYAARDVVATPQPLVDMTVDLALSAYFDGIPAPCLPRVLDFASGSGRFLLSAFDWLAAWKVRKLLENGDTSDLVRLSDSECKLSFDAKKRLMETHLFAIDIDYMAVEVTRLSLLIHLLEDETADSLPRGSDLLPSLQENIVHGNTLVRTLGDDVEQEQRDLTRPLALPRAGFPDVFDVVVGNPPYVRTAAIRSYDRVEYEYLKSNYNLLFKQFDKYMAFIEFGWERLAEHGLLSVVVPNKWLTNVSGERLRTELFRSRALRYLVNFRDVQLFEGRSAYVCILVIGKSVQTKMHYGEPSEIV